LARPFRTRLRRLGVCPPRILLAFLRLRPPAWTLPAMVDIRFAERRDAGTILGFIRGLAEYEREPSAVKVDEATLREQLSAERPPFECLLAELDGDPVGFALFFHTYSTW